MIYKSILLNKNLLIIAKLLHCEFEKYFLLLKYSKRLIENLYKKLYSLFSEVARE